MALERIGIGGVLTFNQGQFVQGTGEARNALDQFVKQADKVPPVMARLGTGVANAYKQLRSGANQLGAGIKQMGTGLAQTALGMAPLTAAVGAGVATAAKFEKQMGAVGAITRASAEDMSRLEAKAEEMGSTSVFTATQSAEAMEFMGRSGASTSEIISGLSGVMNAAAAESIDLATASDLVAQATKIMGREWKQASNTADILALTSMRTNTDMISLGEAIRYGGQSAANMGYTLEETSATLGLLANAGLRGSIGGTSMTNMFNKMLKPSQAASAKLQEWGIRLDDGKGKMKSMADIVQMFSTRLDKIKNPAEKAALTVELFGIRGQRAFQALSKAGPEAMRALTDEMRKASDGIGAAQEAAIKRLDNFSGAWTLFTSAVEGTAIKIFKPLLGPMKEALQGFTEGISNVLLPLGMIRRGFKDIDGSVMSADSMSEKFGSTAVQIALGVNDAIDAMISTWNLLVAKVKAASKMFTDTFGGTTIRDIAKWAVLIGVAAAAVAPLILALVTAGFAVSGIATLVSGLVTVISGAFTVIGGIISAAVAVITSPWLLAFAAMAAAVYFLWDDVFKPIVSGFMSVWGAAVESISAVWSQTFGEVMAVLQSAWTEIKAVFMDLFGSWFEGSENTKAVWIGVGQTLAGVVSTVVTSAIQILGFLIKAATFIGVGLFKILAWPFKMWDKFTQSVFDHILTFMDDGFVAGIVRLGKTIFDVLTAPMRAFLEMAVKAAEIIPGISVPQGIKDFLANGLTGPEPPTVAPGRKNTVAEDVTQQTKDITELKAIEKQKAAEPPKVEANINLEDKRCLHINNKVELDGEQVSHGLARHAQEIQERAGFKATPWQRRVALEQGVAPKKGVA